MTTINQLFKTLESLKASQAAERRVIEDHIQANLNARWNASESLKALLLALDGSNEYGTDQYGEIYRWVRADLSDIVDEVERPYFDVWLQSQDAMPRMDWTNDALTASEGESIIINEDGDVFLNSDVIIDRRSYETDEERNTLIEAWMEKNGYFPGVFRQTRYGDVFPVDTRPEKDGAA